ncbi:MAG: hypothetical protein R2774_00810 [Saprospiraceae bacterium]
MKLFSIRCKGLSRTPSSIRVVSLIFILIILSLSAPAQTVTVSPDIILKNNYSYDLIPNVNEHILFYHDKGNQHVFESYDKNLAYVNNYEPSFEDSHIVPIGVLSLDTVFNFYYYYREKGDLIVKVRRFDEHLTVKDSSTLYIRKKETNEGNPRLIFSENKSKSLLFLPFEKSIHALVIDNYTFSILQNIVIYDEETNLKSEFEKIALSDKGEIVVLAYQEPSWLSKGEESLVLFYIGVQGDVAKQSFVSEQNIIDVLMEFDNRNDRIALAGLIGDADRSLASSYYNVTISPAMMHDETVTVIAHPLPIDLFLEAVPKKKKKVNYIQYLQSKEMLLRYDGGIVLFLEIQKEFIRRGSTQNLPMQNEYFSGRGSIDYYIEDVLVIANNGDGSPHWQKVLYKKQYAQDDENNFASFFIFTAPSFLRVIFNDEIKNYNTVSEYQIDPLGDLSRKSLLSTEYQDLRIRFKDALQISDHEMYIPSEKNNKVNIVKIVF